MSEKKDGGPAFPVGRRETESGALISEWSNGMSLRQFYAGMALQGWGASITQEPTPTSKITARNVAQRMFEIADAMIAEGEK